MNTEERQAEFQPYRLLDEYSDSPGGEQRVEHASVETPDDDPLDHEAQQRRHHKSERNCNQDAGMQPDARHHRGVGANHHQFAMSHIDDAHDAVGDGEAKRHKQQNGADAQANEKRIDHGITTAAAEKPGGRGPDLIRSS